MKNQNLLVTLVILTFLMSLASLFISIKSFRINDAQNEILETMQVVVLNPHLSEEQSPDEEHQLLEEIQNPQAEQDQVAQAKIDQASKPETSKDKPAKAANPEKGNSDKLSLHEQLVQIIAGEQYVDLGLPSGTLWKVENEKELMDFNKARKAYKKRIPSMKQWGELEHHCVWEWTGSGYTVTGPNGATIYLPASGYRNVSGQTGKVGVFGNYWTSSPKGKEEAWRFGFEQGKFSLAAHSRKYGRSIRLVYTPIISDNNK